MMKKLLFALLLIPFFSFSQSGNLNDRKVLYEISQAKISGAIFQQASLFRNLPEASKRKVEENTKIQDATYLDYILEGVASLKKSSPQYLSLEVPLSQRTEQTIVDLIQVDITSSDFTINTDYTPGLYYRGVVRGVENSLVAMSIFDEEVIGFISIEGQMLTIGKVKGTSKTHIIYNEMQQGWNINRECSTTDDKTTYNQDKIAHAAKGRSPGDCVRERIEIDESLTNVLGGIVPATNYATGVFNNQQTLYANDGINVVLVSVKIWTTTNPAPYIIDEFNTLDSFIALGTVYDGEVAYLGLYQGGWSGGVASSIGGICEGDAASRAIGGHLGFYNNVPTYSNDVFIISHEVGHLFGARHTHACVWNGNNTAIDGCAGFVEGNCGLPASPAQGTIMSYCFDVDFNEGFHPQVAQAILNYIATRNCTAPCEGVVPTCNDGILNGNETGIDCGGPDCPTCPTCDDGIQNGDEAGIDCGGPCAATCPCDGELVTVALTLDEYPSETSWQIVDEGGVVVYSGDSYDTPGAVVEVPVCLGNGCFDFIMQDSFGDGICCAYGSGSYVVTSEDGTIYAQGGEFTVSETTNFCIELPATCTDGIQNGDENGIDCGGTSCDPCGDPCDANQVTMSIIFDNYAVETSWNITDQNGVEVYATSYSAVQNNTFTQEFVCLEDGCYTLNFLDAYGDGICCQFGEGSFVLTDVNNNTLASGGTFTYQSSIDFCIGQVVDNCNGYIPARFTLTLDDNPQETKWELYHENGYIAAQGFGFSGLNNETIIDDLCLEPGCYRFFIGDSGDDGICCDFGNGSFMLENLSDNTVVIQGGDNVGSGQLIYFCLSNGMVADPSATVSERVIPRRDGIYLYPNPASDRIYIVSKDDLIGPIEILIFNIKGDVVMRTSREDWAKNESLMLDMNGLSGGVYFVSVTDENSSFREKLILMNE